MITTSIIIPFYQEKAGILITAIDSIVKQEGINFSEIEIIIVDDESPIQVTNELVGVEIEKYNISIIQQQNKGPAGARNKGLDSISKTTQYIAFLDSDDIWHPQHLSQAIRVLSNNYDFYFSDFYQLDQKTSAFSRAKRININEHPFLFEDNTFIHTYSSDMTDQIISGNIIGTPTVAYRLETNPTLRFREELVRAGEDYIFWLELTANNKKIGFSSTPEVTCGRGINVYSGVEFGSNEDLELKYFELKYRKTILNEFILTKSQKKTLRQKASTIKIDFTRTLLHRLKNRKRINYNHVTNFIKLSPSFILQIPYFFSKVYFSK